MPGSKTAFLEQAILNFIFNGTAYVPPATLYIALSNDPFSVSATGTAMGEVTGGSYARIGLTANTTSFPLASGSNPAVVSNGVSVDFAVATADWGTIKSVYATDAATDGNTLYGGDLPAWVAVGIGSSMSIGPSNGIFQEL